MTHSDKGKFISASSGDTCKQTSHTNYDLMLQSLEASLEQPGDAGSNSNSLCFDEPTQNVYHLHVLKPKLSSSVFFITFFCSIHFVTNFM